ncbi:MAG TPA: hypothetical protein VGF48_17780 [Thermoanaerobaculia bacterium]|jgi:hypothetical protein
MKKILMLLLLTTGCSLARLEMPEHESYNVTGANPRLWKRPISFGPWATKTVDMGVRHSWLAGLRGIEIGRVDQVYNLELEGRDGATRVDCHTQDFVIGRNGFWIDPTFGAEPALLCGFERHDQRAVLILGKTGRIEPSLTGDLRNADDENAPGLLIRSLHRITPKHWPSPTPLGYEVVDRGRTVAIVETANRGRVWIDPALDVTLRERIAAASAALLLWQEPEAGID